MSSGSEEQLPKIEPASPKSPSAKETDQNVHQLTTSTPSVTFISPKKVGSYRAVPPVCLPGISAPSNCAQGQKLDGYPEYIRIFHKQLIDHNKKMTKYSLSSATSSYQANNNLDDQLKTATKINGQQQQQMERSSRATKNDASSGPQAFPSVIPDSIFDKRKPIKWTQSAAAQLDLNTNSSDDFATVSNIKNLNIIPKRTIKQDTSRAVQKRSISERFGKVARMKIINIEKSESKSKNTKIPPSEQSGKTRSMSRSRSPHSSLAKSVAKAMPAGKVQEFVQLGFNVPTGMKDTLSLPEGTSSVVPSDFEHIYHAPSQVSNLVGSKNENTKLKSIKR